MGEDGDPEDPERQPLLGGGGPIRVKVVTLQQSLEVEARADGTVDELREAIRAALAIPAAHRVRLIHAGKMLSEGAKTLAECHVINSSVVHCSATEIVEYGDVSKGSDAPASSAGTYVAMPGVPVYPGGPPSNVAPPAEADEEDPDSWMEEVDMEEQRRQMRLLQRLQQARGGSPRGPPRAPGLADEGGEPGGGFDNMLNDPAEGTNADFMCGLSLGFFLGVVMVFMLWEVRMSRQQRLGVVTGIVANGLFAVYRQSVRQIHAAEIIPQQR